jgi:hypothetical protein
MSKKLTASREKARRATESKLMLKKNSMGLGLAKAAFDKRSETGAFGGLAYATGEFCRGVYGF